MESLTLSIILIEHDLIGELVPIFRIMLQVKGIGVGQEFY